MVATATANEFVVNYQYEGAKWSELTSQEKVKSVGASFARICVTNSSPMPRLAPVTTTVAFSIGPPGTYAPAEAEAVA